MARPFTPPLLIKEELFFAASLTQIMYILSQFIKSLLSKYKEMLIQKARILFVQGKGINEGIACF